MHAKQSKETHRYRQSDTRYLTSKPADGFGDRSNGKSYKTYYFRERSDDKRYSTYWHPSFSSGSSEGGNCRPAREASKKPSSASRPRQRTKKYPSAAPTQPTSCTEASLSCQKVGDTVAMGAVDNSAASIGIVMNIHMECIFRINVHEDSDSNCRGDGMAEPDRIFPQLVKARAVRADWTAPLLVHIETEAGRCGLR